MEVGSTGYDGEALQAAILVFVTTALSANITVILRQLRKEHVASLTSANQIVYLIETFYIIMVMGYDMTTPPWADRLKILVIALNTLAMAIFHLLALKLEEANKVSLVSSSGGIVMAFLLQVLYNLDYQLVSVALEHLPISHCCGAFANY